MGKFDFEISTDFIKQLGRLEKVDRIAPKMIDEAMPYLKHNVQRGIVAKTEDSDYSTGAMLASVKSTKAKYISNGFYAVVRPTGKDAKGVRNMEKLAYMEYGTSKQPPTPMLAKAIKDSEPAVLNKMREVFEREVSK